MPAILTSLLNSFKQLLSDLKSQTEGNDITSSMETLYVKSPPKNVQSTEDFILRLLTVRAYTQGL